MTKDRAKGAVDALANRIELLAPYLAKSPDGAEWDRIVINVSPVERDSIVAALRAHSTNIEVFRAKAGPSARGT